IYVDRFVLQEVQVIERLPDWMTELCITRAGIPADKVDIAGTITALDTAAPVPLAVFSDKALQLADLLKQTLDSFAGWYWWDRFGVLRVGRLSLLNKVNSVATFTDIELHGPIGVELDTAPGLSDTVAALRNYSPHETSEIAGSVQATADAGLLAAEYLIRKTTTNRLAAAYARARGAEPIVSLLTTETAAQTLVNYLATFYAVPRQFFTFSAFVDDADIAATEPGQIVTIKTDRTRRYGLKDGRQVQILGVNSRLLSNLCNFVAIG
ncbi:MAG TPA: hypothetical protein VM555_02185, partial [Tahibacter sp.]|nr:hypothetical protein [Tahibacter sp.]